MRKLSTEVTAMNYGIYSLKGFPKHLVRVTQSPYWKHLTLMENGGKGNMKLITIDQEVLQGCLLLPILFNTYTDYVIKIADYLFIVYLTMLSIAQR